MIILRKINFQMDRKYIFIIMFTKINFALSECNPHFVYWVCYIMAAYKRQS